MAREIMLSPEKYLEYSRKFAAYRAELDKLAVSIEADIEASYPACMESQIRREDLHEAAARLRMQGEHLNVYSHALANLADILREAETFYDPVFR